MAHYLDENGVAYLWSKIKGMFAPKASPEFTGTPIAPTPATSDDSNKIATTAYVKNVVEGIDGATYSLTQSQSDGHILRFTGSDGTDTEITIPDNDTTYSNATSSADGLMSSSDFSKLAGFSDASNYALKSEITGVYKYKGSVVDYEHLPSSGQTSGDVYDVQDTGMNYAWNGTGWDALGMSFTITSISNATIDTICV